MEITLAKTVAIRLKPSDIKKRTNPLGRFLLTKSPPASKIYEKAIKYKVYAVKANP